VTDQLPLPGPEKGLCQCLKAWPSGPDTCGRFGRLGEPDRQGRRHVKGCDCRRCLGRRSRRNGKGKQRAARKALGIPGLSLGADEEELWRGHVRVEVKSGHRDTVPVDTRYRAMRKQSDASRAIGDNRPFAAVVMPPGMSDGYAIVKLSELRDVAWAVVGHETDESAQ
jgi:hypothetical protein